MAQATRIHDDEYDELPETVRPLDAPPPTVTGWPAPPARAGRTAEGFGLSVLAYILSTDLLVYGFLSDEDLQLADHAARIAVSSRDILPVAVDRISAVRMTIAGILKYRAQETAPAPTPSPAAVRVAVQTPKPAPAWVVQDGTSYPWCTACRAYHNPAKPTCETDSSTEGGTKVPVHPRPSSPPSPAAVPLPAFNF